MIKVDTRKNGTKRVRFYCEGESKTEQSHAKSVDINEIMARARRGIVPKSVYADAMYGDFTDVVSFHEAQDKVISAREDFARLPAPVRERFKGDPGELIDFLARPENRSEAIKLGLVSRDANDPFEPGEVEPRPVGPIVAKGPENEEGKDEGSVV